MKSPKNRIVILRSSGSGASSRPADGMLAGPRFEANEETSPGLTIDVEDTVDRELMRTLRTDPSVVSIAPAMPLRLIEPFAEDGNLHSEDSDGATWGLKAIRADSCPFDGSGIKVAVLDTGIDANHEAFTGMELDQ